MPRFKPTGLAELQMWTRSDNIMDAYRASSKPTGPSSKGIESGIQGVNIAAKQLMEEYVEEYGPLTTEEAKLVVNAIFPRRIAEQMTIFETFNSAQLEFVLEIGAYALVMDYDSAAIQFTKFNIPKAVKAALDLWDTPDADDYRDELKDGFDDLSIVSKAVVLRFDNQISGEISDYFKGLK